MASLKVTKILGLNGNDVIYGTAASEEIYGFCGDDSIYGGGGNDTLFGGTGFDTAYFSGDCSDYQIVKVAGGLQITQIKGSFADGSDFVSTDIERIIFKNGIYDGNCCDTPKANIAAPVARADTNWVKEDTNLAATGNVLKAIKHSGAPAGTFADRADTDADSAILKVKNPGTIDGIYGRLVLQANGKYTYTLYSQAEKPAAYATVQALAPGDTPLVETFNYKVSDGLHVAKSTLKISVFGSDDDVRIGGLTGADQTVFESHLSASRGIGKTDGSAPDAAALTQLGTFTLSAADGYGNLTVGGTQFTSNGVVGNLNVAIFTTYGTLKITGVNLSTGVVSYAYTLTDNTPTHGPADNGPNTVLDNIAIDFTDRNGSHATASLVVKIVDDVPSIQLSATEGQFLTVDETNLGTNASGSFANLFSSSYGADGPGSIAYKLGITAGDSGLIDSATGEHVMLSLVSGAVEGRTATGHDLVFTIAVDSAGNVSLDQARALQHPDDSNPDDSVALASAHLVTLTATITDGDGDTASQTADIGGAFVFKDDAPKAYNDGPTAVEGGVLLTVSAATGVLANDHIGADQPGLVTAIAGGALDSEVTGLFGKLTLHADGSYTYLPNISVAAGSVDSFVYTMNDHDGDASSATLSFTFAADNSAPTAGVSYALVDEDDLPAGNHDAAPGDDNPAPSGTLTHDYGADGAGFIKLVAGTEIVNGVTYHYTVNATGTELTGNDGTHDVFKVTLTDAVAGTYTTQLLAAIDHPIAGTEDNLVFKLGYEVFDSDSVTGVAGTLNLTVDDDSPTAGDGCIVLQCAGHDDDNHDDSGGASHSAVVGESQPDQSQTGASGGDGRDSCSSGDDGSGVCAIVTGTLTHSYGADVTGHIALGSVILPADGNFSQTGSGNQIVISQGNVEILKIDLTDAVSGAYKLTQLASIDHSSHHSSGDSSSDGSATDENSNNLDDREDGSGDAVPVAFTLTYSVEDHDHDVANGTLTIKLLQPADDGNHSSQNHSVMAEVEQSAPVTSDGDGFAFAPVCGTELPSDIVLTSLTEPFDPSISHSESADPSLTSGWPLLPIMPQIENHEGLL